MTNQPLIFFGNEQLASGLNDMRPIILEALLKKGYAIKLVVLYQKKTKTKQSQAIITLAKQYNVPVLSPLKPIEIKQKLIDLKPVTAVLVAYGRIIPEEILEIFPQGIINIHPSLLPQYRGPSPVEQTILDNVHETGVSLIRLVKEMDEGPIFAQSRMTLTAQETKTTLAQQLQKMGRDILLHNIDQIIEGKLKPQDQNPELASYTKLLSKEDGLVRFESAELTERQIRALNPWPGAYFTAKNELIFLLEAKSDSRVLNQTGDLMRDGKELLLGFSNGTLKITKLKIAGKNIISDIDYINAHPDLGQI